MGDAAPAIATSSEVDPGLVFLGEAERAFERAHERAGGHLDAIEIAGVRVDLAFAGEAMRAALLPPLEHLACGDRGEAAIRISVFDSASTGVGAPDLPWRPPRVEPGKSPVARYETEECCLLASAATGSLAAVDFRRGTAVFHLDDTAALPANERAAQLRETLHLLLSRHDRWLTHAGAVGRDGRGALVVGRGGSGKSTLCLGSARAGMEIAADDYVALEPAAAGPVAHALLSTVKLTEESAALLGIGPDLVAPGEFVVSSERVAKAEVPVERLAPGRIRTSLEIVALVAPKIAGLRKPRLERISGARGLRSLAPSTVMQTRTRGPSALPALARLARAVPCYELELSTDVGANAEAVARVVGGDA